MPMVDRLSNWLRLGQECLNFYLWGVRKMTWSCPRCGRPFVTEAQMIVHYMSCGAHHPPFVSIEW